MLARDESALRFDKSLHQGSLLFINISTTGNPRHAERAQKTTRAYRCSVQTELDSVITATALMLNNDDVHHHDCRGVAQNSPEVALVVGALLSGIMGATDVQTVAFELEETAECLKGYLNQENI